MIPSAAGRTPTMMFFKILLSLNFWKNTAATAQMVKVGIRTPRAEIREPRIPATRIPAKVAQFRPMGPGVISAMATISDTSEAVIQPWLTISSLISGTIDIPPKLV